MLLHMGRLHVCGNVIINSATCMYFAFDYECCYQLCKDFLEMFDCYDKCVVRRLA